MTTATIYIDKYEDHILKSWVPYSVHKNMSYRGDNWVKDKCFVCDEDTLSQILYFLSKSTENYNSLRRKLQQAGKNIFKWK